MVLVKILKRKDAFSVLVAIVLASILIQLLTPVTMELSARLSGTYHAGQGPYNDWKTVYLQPAAAAVLQVGLLELLAWVYILGKSAVKRG